MARKFFNQKVKGSSNKKIITYIIIGGCAILLIVCIILIWIFTNRMPDNAVVEMRDLVTVEINSDFPDKTLFFAELQNVSEDAIDVSYDNADLTKAGEYTVEVHVYNQRFESTLAVVDTESPVLTVKNYTIEEGDTYTAQDFVESCSDNSGECETTFYEYGMDQTGEVIDYSSYTELGSYAIKLIAHDPSGNASTVVDATLTIGEASEIETTTCDFGNGEYDSDTYILGVNVTQNNCALDLNLYYNETVKAPAYELVDIDTENIRKEIAKLNINNVENYNLRALITPVLNTSGTGVVGYTVYREISITYTDGTNELVASYYIDTNGNRIYSTNIYDLN